MAHSRSVGMLVSDPPKDLGDPSLPPVEVVDRLPVEALPAAIAHLAALQARAAARLAAEAGNSAAGAAQCDEYPGRLLTVPEVAERLRVPKQRAYELAR